VNTVITARGAKGNRLAYKSIFTSFKIQNEKMLFQKVFVSIPKLAGKLPIGLQQKLLSRTVAQKFNERNLKSE